MTEIAALLPPAAPRTSPTVNVMGYQLERRASASTALAAVREAAHEDPRAALRAAHQARRAAESDVARLTDILDRARQHLDVITARLRAAEKAAQHVSDAAADGLIAALSANASPVAAVDDQESIKAERLARETEIARTAVARLDAELGDAQERARIATWRVRALALARLEKHGIEIAESMLAEQQEMRRRRTHLAELQSLLSTEGRLIYGDGVSTPAVISAATTAIDPPKPWKPSSPLAPRQVEPPNPWSKPLAALIADAEVEAEIELPS